MRHRHAPTTILLALGLLAPALAQRPAGAPRPAQQRPAAPPEEDDEVVRITSNLVQLDVVVTDKDGRPMTDLRADEFRLFEEGREREITHFSYVSTAPEVAGDPSPARKPEKGAAVAPATAGRPLPRRQVRRTFVLIGHNLRMSFGSVGNVRNAMRKFVDEQMRPGDLVGIYGTRGGVGALQQLTSDRAQLHKAIDGFRWYPPTLGDGGGIDPFGADRDDSTYKPVRAGSGAGPRGAQTFEDENARAARRRLEARGNDLQAYDALATLRYVLEGLRHAPGRKVVVFFSDGMPLFSDTGESGLAADRLNRAADLANRAGAVIYTVDARGVTLPGDVARRFTAESDAPIGAPAPPAMSRPRPPDDDALDALAGATGGLYIRNVNFMDKVLERVVRDQSGFYLLGYRPTEETFRGGARGFREISVKVTRPGLRVRARKGFFAVTDEEDRAQPRGSDRELYSVLASPVNAGDVYVRLTAKAVGDPRAGGAAARMLLHVDGKDLTFTDDANGYKKLVLDVAAVTLGRDGEIVDEFNRTHTVRTGGDILENILRNGLTYAADVPVKRPGVYQLRIVVRDQASKRLGSASQQLEVPDPAKQLAMSGLSLREATPDALAPAEPTRATAETAIAAVTSPSDPAVRRFRPGAVLLYAYQVYNPSADPSTRRPRLTAQVLLFRNGEPVLTGPAEAAEPDPATGRVEGGMRLAPNATPGEYVLQVVVTDEAAKDKSRRRASQWIDFEVEK